MKCCSTRVNFPLHDFVLAAELDSRQIWISRAGFSYFLALATGGECLVALVESEWLSAVWQNFGLSFLTGIASVTSAIVNHDL